MAGVVMLALHVILAARSLVLENPTIDEVIHLPAGVSYWQKGSFRLYHHNPPLVKLIAALPVVLAGPKMDYTRPSWRVEPPNKMAFGHEFMEANASRYFELFTMGRLLMPLFSIVGGLVIFAWSRRLYGETGGLLSLALWVLCPNILAHTRLITTDLGATAFGVLATYLFWRYLKAPSWRLAAISGVCLGLAELTKFSLILLYGLGPILLIARLASDPFARRSFGKTILQCSMIVSLSVLVIDLGYGFEGVGIPLGKYEFVCQTLTRPVPRGVPRPRSTDALQDGAWRYRVNRFRGTPLGLLPVPLPEHYLLGFDDQKLEAEGIPNKFLADPNEPIGPEGDAVQGYPVYLDGELRQKSWWYYYLDCLAYKIPEGTWLIVMGSFAVSILSARSRASWFDEFAILIVPAFVLFVMSIFTNINLGLRYVLPIFPFVFIAAGKVAVWTSGILGERSRRIAWTSVGLALGATAAGTAAIHPHYLAYFNVLSGGPDKGANHLIDSNIDWGQDLLNLRRWIAANAPDEPVGLAYFGQIHPLIFQDRGDDFAWFLPPPRPSAVRWYSTPSRPGMLNPNDGDPRYSRPGADRRLKSGLYAVSASLVKGLPWRVYDRPVTPDSISRRAPYSVWMDAYSYFQRLQPFAKVGHSIFLYRVTTEQADRINRDILDLAPLP